MLVELKKAPGVVGYGSSAILVLVVLVFILGFVASDEARAPMARPEEEPRRMSAPSAPTPAYQPSTPFAGTLRSSGKIYYRQAQLQLAVADTLQGNDELEKIAVEHKCEVDNLILEGNDQSRRCQVELRVPSDRFDAVVRQLRKIGAVLSERITAQRIEGGASASGDVRTEFAHVRVELIDDGARRGTFARSFDSSGHHFVKGSALLLEGAGYILPFLLAVMVPVGLIVLGKRFRRGRSAD